MIRWSGSRMRWHRTRRDVALPGLRACPSTARATRVATLVATSKFRSPDVDADHEDVWRAFTLRYLATKRARPRAQRRSESIAGKRGYSIIAQGEHSAVPPHGHTHKLTAGTGWLQRITCVRRACSCSNRPLDRFFLALPAIVSDRAQKLSRTITNILPPLMQCRLRDDPPLTLDVCL